MKTNSLFFVIILTLLGCQQKNEDVKQEPFINLVCNELYLDARVDSVLGIFVKEVEEKYKNLTDTCCFHIYLDNTYKNNPLLNISKYQKVERSSYNKMVPSYFNNNSHLFDSINNKMYIYNEYTNLPDTSANFLNLSYYQGFFLIGTPGIDRKRADALCHINYHGRRIDIHYGIEPLFNLKYDLIIKNNSGINLVGYKWSVILSEDKICVIPGIYKEFNSLMYPDEENLMIVTDHPYQWNNNHKKKLKENYTDLSMDRRIHSILDQFITDDLPNNYRYEINVNEVSDISDWDGSLNLISIIELIALPVDSVSKEYTDACLFYFLHNDTPVYVRSNLEKLFRTEHSINQNPYNLDIDSVKDYIRKWKVEFTYNDMKVNILDNGYVPQYIRMKYGELDSLYATKKDKDNWKTTGWMEFPFSEKRHWIQVYGDIITKEGE